MALPYPFYHFRFTFNNTPMLRSVTQYVFASLLLAAPAAFVSAQNFVPPSVNTVAYTFTNPVVNQLQSTSAYSVAATYLNIPSAAMGLPGHPDLYVSGWNNPTPGGNSEVSILLTQSANPSNIYWQGSLPYQNVMDLEVGCVGNYFSSSAYTSILVAYYLPGQGHRLDIYNFNGPAGAPLQLVEQKILSTSTTYGRIKMDCREVTDCAVAWINPGVGIQTMVHKGANTWSPIATLSGTNGKTTFDIAIDRVYFNPSTSASTRFAHFVYPNGLAIVKSSVNMDNLATATAPSVVAPTVNDNNYVGPFGLASKLVLDCADFADTSSSWAYTYTDGVQVSVRHKNHTLPGTGQTAIITAGVLANSNPLDTTFSGAYRLFSPALNYGRGIIGSSTLPNRIMVAWYATNSAGFNGYIAAEMNENGTTLTSDPDFLLLPSGQTPTMPSGFTPGITLSKIGIKSVPDFLYTTYYDVDPVTGDYQMHHAFHTWGDTRFRPGNNNSTGINAAEPEQIKINAFPNPFSSRLSISVTMPKNGKLNLVLTDISGRNVWQRELTVDQGIHLLEVPGLDHLAPGTYTLSSSLDRQRIGTSKIVKR